MNLCISIFIAIIVTSIPLIPFIVGYIKSNNKLVEYLKNNKNILICVLIIFFACLVRTIYIDKFPAHFNQDEASIGYEAYSILNFGIDRNGMSYPVHFIAWGSGQNVLYAYILIPFIKILGLNIFSVRLPMAIIGCISVLVWYNLLKLNLKNINRKFIMSLFFFCFFPLLVIKSRWALESNIFLDLILYATFFINKFVVSKKSKYLYLAAIFIGISAYSYGTSYVFLPIYCLILSIYMFKNKHIDVKKFLIFMLIVFIIVFPMVLFTIINYFDLETIKIGNITIPKMVISRLHETNINNETIGKDIISNIISNFFIIIFGFDGIRYNHTYISVIISYLFNIFLVLHIFSKKNTKKNLIDELMKIWLIASVITVTFFSIRLQININRINILLIPIIYFSIKKICNVDNKKIYIALSSLIILFIVEYFSLYNIGIKNKSNSNDFQEAIQYINNIDANKTIYIDPNIIKEPYIYYLFTTKMNPKEYVFNVDKNVSENSAFEQINKIGNVHFKLPDDIEQDSVIITQKNENMSIVNKNIKDFGKLIVIY